MRNLQNDYNQYVATSTATTLHTGSGWVRVIIATGTSTTVGQLSIYDNTTTSNMLLRVQVEIRAPVIIILPLELPLKFSTGLHVVTDANCRAYLLTEL